MADAAYMRDWHARHPGKRAEYQRRWRAKGLEDREAKRTHERDRYRTDEEFRQRYARKYEVRRQALIDSVPRRLGWSCALCGWPIDPKRRGPDPWAPSVDHIVPRRFGGGDEPANLQLTHLLCNKTKGDKVDPGWFVMPSLVEMLAWGTFSSGLTPTSG